MNSGEFQKHTEQLDGLVRRVSAFADDDARTVALELLQSVMDLHGAAFSRVIELLSDSGEAGRKALAKLSVDPLICGLLVLYGIHPVPLEERAAVALEKITTQLHQHSATAELMGIADGVVRVKVSSSSHGCGSDSVKNLVEQAILEAAPEVVEIAIEGLPSSASGFVPLNMIQSAGKEESKYEKSTA